nr:hypothetical protein [Kocuria rhizophila]
MHNPAAELMELFDSWTAADSYAINQLKIQTPEGWTEFTTAMRLLQEIAETLSYMRERGFDVDEYLEHLPYWRSSVLHYPNTWRDRPLSLESRSQLAALKPLYQVAAVPTLGSALPDDARQLLDDTEAAIASDPDLDESLKRYVAKLVTHLRSVLDEEKAGFAFDAQESFRHLKFCMDAAAEQTKDPDRKDRFRDFARRWAAPFASDVTTGVLSGAALLALDPGN